MSLHEESMLFYVLPMPLLDLLVASSVIGNDDKYSYDDSLHS